MAMRNTLTQSGSTAAEGSLQRLRLDDVFVHAVALFMTVAVGLEPGLRCFARARA
jgi:hypothetical protein